MKFFSITLSKSIWYITFVLFSCILIFSSFPSLVNAETYSNELITTQEDLTIALHNAKNGDTLLVGDIQFSYSPMGMTLSKNVTIKSGKDTQAVFSGGAFAVMGSSSVDNTMNLKFENINFAGINDIKNTDFSGTPSIMSTTKIRPALFFSRCVNASFIGCNFNGYSMSQGGALYGIYSSSDTKNYELSLYFENCTLNENAAGYGGAIYLSGAGNISLTMKDCELSGNVAAQGGAIFAHQSSVNLINCTISKNRFANFYPDSQTYGGGIYAVNSNLLLTNCHIIDNTGMNGGGIALSYTESTIDGCIISGNSAISHGGAIWNKNSGNNYVTIMNTTLANNKANEYGSIYIDEHEVSLGEGGIGKTFLILCTLSDNSPCLNDYSTESLSFFGNAMYGEVLKEEQPSNDNHYCYYTQSSHGGNPYTHLHSTYVINDAVLDSVANGKFSNRYGTFFAGDNSKDFIDIHVNLWENENYTLSIPYGQDIVLQQAERKNYLFDGWYYENGVKFNGTDLFCGGNVDKLNITAQWKLSTKAIILLVLIPVVLISSIGYTVNTINKRIKLATIPKVTQTEIPNESITAKSPVSRLPEDVIEHILIQWEDTKSLTTREKEVLILLLCGKKRKDIACNLYITEHTVKDHISKIYSKLNVKNRSELFSKANFFK